MRWQKAARAIVAVVGLGTAAAIYALTRERPTPKTPPPSTSTDPAANFQSGAGTDVRHEGNRLVARSEYGQVRRYDDRMEWDDFKLTLEDGAMLSAKRVQGKFTGSNRDLPSQFTFQGDVRFQSSDGAALSGDSGTYDSDAGLANIPGRVVMTRGRLAGQGTGGTYERTTGTFKLLADARLTITPEGGGAPIESSSGAMTFTGGGATILMDAQARIGREAETMTADRATLYMENDQFKTIELRGRARVTPVPGRGSAIPDLQAEDMELEFYEGGGALRHAALHRQAILVQAGEQGKRSITAAEIGFNTAPDGTTLTRLDAVDHVVVTLPATSASAARTITGPKLTATGNDANGLTSAVVDGGAEFVETVPAASGRPASRRVGRGQRLAMTLKGQLDAIDAARFEKDVKFTSGDVTGDGDIGDYRANKGELELRPTPQTGQVRRVRVADGQVVVEAAESIVVDLNTNDLHARRSVTTVSRSDPKSGAGSAAMFDMNQPLYGSGTEFWYESEAQRFRYAGDEKTRAQLRQTDDSVVIGREVLFLQRSQDLSATGQVESTFLVTNAGASTSTRYRATAETFAYADAERLVTYRGAPASLKNGEDETLAQQIVLVLAKEARTLERMEATGAVRTSLQQGRQALGERLIFEAGSTTYRLWGKPLTLWTRDADGTCSSQSGNFVKFAGDVGAPDFPKAENPAGNTLSSKLTCPAFLAVKK